MVEDALADVDLIVDFSCGNHVKYLQPNKEVEDESHMARTVSIYVLQVDDFLVELVPINLVKSTWEDLIVFFHTD